MGPGKTFAADFESGIQQTNIKVGAPGTMYVGEPTAVMNKPCPSSVGLMTASEEPVARAMIKFMTSPEAAALLRETPVEPAKP